MSTTTTKKPWTADELARLPAGWRYEIDAGELATMARAGPEHGERANWIAHLITGFVHRHRHRLGKVYAAETGFYLRSGPGTREILRAADVTFLSNERVARITDAKRFTEVPPDLTWL